MTVLVGQVVGRRRHENGDDGCRMMGLGEKELVVIQGNSKSKGDGACMWPIP